MTEALTETPAASGGKRKAKRYLLWALAVWLAGFLIYTLMPERPLDLWEEEPLRSMLLPVKVVEAWGSGYPPEVYVSIVDGNDRRIGMTFRYNDLNPWTAYPDAMMKLTTQEAEPRWKARVPGGFFGV